MHFYILPQILFWLCFCKAFQAVYYISGIILSVYFRAAVTK